MFEPIKISKFGDKLDSYPQSKDCDETKIQGYIGTHEICSGFVDVKDASETYRALCCRSCGLRIMIPVELKTLGELRNYMKDI